MKRLALNHVRARGHMPRVPCSISRKEFTEHFIRKMSPALLIGCDYKWLEDNHDLSVASVTKVKIVCNTCNTDKDIHHHIPTCTPEEKAVGCKIGEYLRTHQHGIRRREPHRVSSELGNYFKFSDM